MASGGAEVRGGVDQRGLDELNADLPPEVYGPPEPARPEPGSREEMLYLRRTSTWVNMVIALVACVLVVVLIVAIVPRTSEDFSRDIDVAEVAQQAEGSVDFTFAQPDMGKGWSANEATFSDTGQPPTPTWYISLIGPNDQWVTVVQADTESDAWLKDHLDTAEQQGPVEAGGREWDSFMTTDDAPKRYLVTRVDGATLIVAGQAAGGTLESAAQKVLASIDA